MKTYSVTKEWYISAVKAALVLRGMTENLAAKAIELFGLQECLDRSSLYLDHYDPVDIADEIFEKTE